MCIFIFFSPPSKSSTLSSYLFVCLFVSCAIHHENLSIIRTTRQNTDSLYPHSHTERERRCSGDLEIFIVLEGSHRSQEGGVCCHHNQPTLSSGTQGPVSREALGTLLPPSGAARPAFREGESCLNWMASSAGACRLRHKQNPPPGMNERIYQIALPDVVFV